MKRKNIFREIYWVQKLWKNCFRAENVIANSRVCVCDVWCVRIPRIRMSLKLLYNTFQCPVLQTLVGWVTFKHFSFLFLFWKFKPFYKCFLSQNVTAKLLSLCYCNSLSAYEKSFLTRTLNRNIFTWIVRRALKTISDRNKTKT